MPDNFQTYFMNLLRTQPGIKEIRTYEVPRVERPLVVCDDDTEIYLSIVGTYPPGGARPEDAPVITRPAGQPIKVIYRDQKPRKGD